MELFRRIVSRPLILVSTNLRNPVYSVTKKALSTSAVQEIRASELTKENILPIDGCPVCSRGITFKMTDVLFLSQFMTPEGFMINRRKTGVCKKQHRQIFKFIHIARRIGLLPRKPPKDGGDPPEYGQKSKSMTKRTYKSKF